MRPEGDSAGAPSWGVVLVAAGGGTRFGGPVPKQFLPLDGLPLVEHGLRAALAVDRVRRMVVVLPPGDGWRSRWKAPDDPRVLLVEGGAVRSDSVLAGLQALDGLTHAAVHDAARPLAPPALFERVMDAAENHGAAVPLQPVSSTVKRLSHDGKTVGETLDRSSLRLSQTPQAAARIPLMEALRQHPDSTDEAAALERSGVRVAAVEGEGAAMKVTRPGDLETIKSFLPEEETAFGTGLDFHPLVEGRPMVACGVRLDDEVGPDGHSDGDAALHAAADAVLAAARIGDIGQLFPPGDPDLEGADSAMLLRRAVEAAGREGWRVESADLTIIGSRPRVLPVRRSMMAALAGALGCPISRVWVKGTTTNGMGDLGNGKAMGAMALVRMARRTPGRSRR
jgi:2-C-methyl-D-erythritol 4-phosphate cytidylyltransferase/2-C-methyl-D-erythritol 2,4-cyclodiphosphate synthase